MFILAYSLRVVIPAVTVIFFFALFIARIVSKLSGWSKKTVDILCMMPLVVPPSGIGYILIQLGVSVTAICTFVSAAAAFPLLYCAARESFAGFAPQYLHAAQTLGRSDTWIFWRLLLPYCRQSILTGTILSLIRAVGEYHTMFLLYAPSRQEIVSVSPSRGIQWLFINIVVSVGGLLIISAAARHVPKKAEQ